MLPLGIVMELTLTGEAISAERMYQTGFVNRLVGREELMPTAIGIAESIRDNAPLSVRAAKESLLRGMDLGLKVGFEKAIEIYQSVYESEDAKEGPRAFAEKRKPKWKGR
jgi:enoyl-CoA hydratase/carnithine racemase